MLQSLPAEPAIWTGRNWTEPQRTCHVNRTESGWNPQKLPSNLDRKKHNSTDPCRHIGSNRVCVCAWVCTCVYVCVCVCVRVCVLLWQRHFFLWLNFFLIALFHSMTLKGNVTISLLTLLIDTLLFKYQPQASFSPLLFVFCWITCV